MPLRRSTPGIGWFVYIRKGVYQRFISWLFETTTFEFATKNEAIVGAPWVRLCASYYGIAAVLRKITHIHTTRGDSTIARSVARAVVGFE